MTYNVSASTICLLFMHDDPDSSLLDGLFQVLLTIQMRKKDKHVIPFIIIPRAQLGACNTPIYMPQKYFHMSEGNFKILRKIRG